MSPPIVNAVITDLDDTLWDWFEIWHSSFRAMLDALIAKTGMEEAELLPEIKKVHQRHGTAEYVLLLQELPIIRKTYQNADFKEEFQAVFTAHAKARKKATKLYPSVRQTLQHLRAQGVPVIGFTESQEFNTKRRIRNTSLDGLLEYVYSPKDHSSITDSIRNDLRTQNPEHYELKYTKYRFTPVGASKPSPEILSSIISDQSLDPGKTIYVGDKLVKDVTMAQESGAIDVYAAYGDSNKDSRYDLLRSVTFWTEKMVQREKEATPSNIKPTYTLDKEYGELLEMFDFAGSSIQLNP